MLWDFFFFWRGSERGLGTWGTPRSLQQWSRGKCSPIPGCEPSSCSHFGLGADIRRCRARVWETHEREVTRSQLYPWKASWKLNSSVKDRGNRNGKHLRSDHGNLRRGPAWGAHLLPYILSRYLSGYEAQPGNSSFSNRSEMPQVNGELLVADGASWALGGILEK